MVINLFFDLIIASILGLATGFVLQRGRVCSNTIFRNLTLLRNDELFLIIILTICIQLIGYEILALLEPGSFTSNPIPLSWLFLPIGSIIFGIGTVYAGGCAGGVCYRIGEGNSKSLLAFFGYAAGIAILAIGPVAQVFSYYNAETLVTYNGAIPSLELIFPRIIWTFLAAVIAILYVYRYYNLHRHNQLKVKNLLPFWTPIASGIALGCIGITMKISRNFSFSTIDGIGNIFLSLISFTLPDWAGFFIFGLIVGSFVSALNIKEFQIPYVSLKDFIQFIGGGLLLGLGAMMAGGCNFGHILGGIPELGLSSILAFPLMILGNWIGSYIFYIRFNQPLPKSTPT